MSCNQPLLMANAGDFTISTSGASLVTTLSNAKPANVSDGDLLIAIVTSQVATGQDLTITTGSWNRVGPAATPSKKASTVFLLPVPSASALTDLSWTASVGTGSAGRMQFVIYRITLADLSAPLDSASSSWESSSATTAALADFVTTNQNTLEIAFFHSTCTMIQGNPNYTDPFGWSLVGLVNNVASGVGSSDGLWVGTSNKGAIGAVGPTAINTTTAQSSINGYQIAIKGAPLATVVSPTPGASYLVEYTDNLERFTASRSYSYGDLLEEAPARVTIIDTSGNEQPISSYHIYAGAQTISSLFSKNPLYVASGGATSNYPEETIYGYTKCINQGVRALEISVNVSSDGVFVCSNDTNTSRVTGQSYVISSTSWAALSALTVKPVGTNDQAQPPRPLARIEDVVSLYGHDPVLFVEDKTYLHTTSLLNYLDTIQNNINKIVWKVYGSSGVASASAARARGYKIFAYYLAADLSNISLTYANYDYIGIDPSCTDSQVSSVVAMGKPCFGYIVSSSAQVARLTSLGCVGIITSDISNLFPGY